MALANVKTMLILLGWGAGHAIVVTTRCEFHNDTLCAETQGGAGCNETQECEPPEPEKRTHCFVLWQNDSTGKPFIKLKVSLVIMLMVQ